MYCNLKLEKLAGDLSFAPLVMAPSVARLIGARVIVALRGSGGGMRGGAATRRGTAEAFPRGLWSTEYGISI